MPPNQLYDNQSRPIQLSKQIGTGGEGAVFDIVGDPSRVAKLYHKLRPEREDKLRAMVRLGTKELQTVAAWPLATLHDRPGGSVVGLVMQKVSNRRELHYLYSAATRRIHYPSRDWRFLIYAARNCAAAIHTIHSAGVVIGDVNQSNLMVCPQASIMIIDCDSFQIQQGGVTYYCEVGVDLFTPPELQGRPFTGVTRTPNHDYFGLAVLIFQLLFMGRHPFSGRYLGQGDMPIDKAIQDYRFAYAPGANSYQMEPPPKALTLKDVPPSIANLMVRAFDRGPHGRPTAIEWVNELTSLYNNVRRCSVHHGHYHASPHGCPWCQLIQQGAPDFFVTVVPLMSGQTGRPFILKDAWTEIEHILSPQFKYFRPSIPVVAAHPWPGHLPATLPQQVPVPSILTQTPVQPPSRVAKPMVKYIKTPPTVIQQLVGNSVVFIGACAIFFLLCAALLITLDANRTRGVSGMSKISAGLGLIGGISLVPTVMCVVVWMLLESERRKREEAANEGYYAAQRTYQRDLQTERVTWERLVEKKREIAQQKYNQEKREWERIFLPMRAEGERRRGAYLNALKAFEEAEKEWQAAALRITQTFDQFKDELKRQHDRYKQIDTAHKSERLQLQNKARDLQLQQFLDQHLIEDARIEKIGDGRKAILSSFGIETALDVVEVNILGVIPGFGPALTSYLMNWRQSVESQFVFNAAQGVPPQQQQALDQNYRSLKAPLETALRTGSQQLQQIIARGNNELQTVRTRIEKCALQLEQAKANLSVIPKGV